MKQEFHICVTPMGQDEYLLQTEQVALGVPMAQELANWPVDDWLMQTECLLSDKEKTQPIKSLDLVTLGHQLYCALFQGSLKDSWLRAQAAAQHQQDVLQLRLGLKESRLARLPWEALHTGNYPVATDPRIAFSRYQAGIKPVVLEQERTVQEETLQQGVKVLMVMAAPTAQASLALKPLIDLQFTVLEQPEREQLIPTLEQEGYKVLHYIGHSQLGSAGSSINLICGETSLTKMLSGDELADLLVKNGVQMAVLNFCCNNAEISDATTDKGFSNLTQVLLQHGVKSVLTMAKPVPERVALTLIHLFYRHLSQGHSVDLSLSQARAGLISTYGFDQLYWALPILYLQPEFDGYLDATIELDLLSGEDWEEPFDETECQDPTYKQDAALVSDLFRQLTTAETLPTPTKSLVQLTDEIEHLHDSPTLEPTLLSFPGTKTFKSWIESAKETSIMVWLASGMVGASAIILGILWCQGMLPRALNLSAPGSQMQLKNGYSPRHQGNRN